MRDSCVCASTCPNLCLSLAFFDEQGNIERLLD